MRVTSELVVIIGCQASRTWEVEPLPTLPQFFKPGPEAAESNPSTLTRPFTSWLLSYNGHAARCRASMSHLGEVPIRRRVWLTSTGGDPGIATKAGTESHTRARPFLYRTPGQTIPTVSSRSSGSSDLAPIVSHTVMAPSGRARRLYLPSLVDTAGRARGLSGAPRGARDLAAAPYRAASVLIPMGG